MTKRMLIDATHAEETRVVVLDGQRLEDFDVESATKKQLKGNIYLARVVRVEPSLQACFVEYGGGRHGFLAFGEIHPDYYQIPVADRQRLLEIAAEEAREEEEAEERAALRQERGDRPERGERPERGDRGPRQRDREPGWAVRAEAPDAVTAETTPEEAPAVEAIDPVAEQAETHVPQPTPEHHAADETPAAVETAPIPAEAPVVEPASPEIVEVHAEIEPAPSPIVQAAPEPDAEPDAPRSGPAQAASMPIDTRYGDANAPAPAAEPVAEDDEPLRDFHNPGPGITLAGDADGAVEDDALAEGSASDAGEDAGNDDLIEVTEPEGPPPETIGGEQDQFEGNGAEEASRRRASRMLRNYRIQEVIRRRQILLIQVVKEERGTKGAALTTYISLAGRFCVLMPNSPRGGGISRKITSSADRKRLKEITAEMEIPKGMGLIVRTAGANRPKPEIRRDCEYLMRLWDDIRDLTLKSMAPALIYEEASLIKRSIRDVYSRDVDEIIVDGEAGWKQAYDFMRMLMPSHAKKVQLWRPTGIQMPLFAKHQVDLQLDAMLSPTVQLRSGGYLVINQTEALVAIDVNSGRSTRERGIEETALKTNLEAAEEVARQLRLRDLAGLIVIDFIDMEARRANAMVEKRLKDALKNDRARIQLGSISHFGLLEMSRQRLRPSLAETSFVTCPHCNGLGHVRGVESAAVHVLRAIEEEGAKLRAAAIMLHAAGPVVMYILNNKRDRLGEIEARYAMRVSFAVDDSLLPPAVRIDRLRPQVPEAERLLSAAPAVVPMPPIMDEVEDEEEPDVMLDEAEEPAPAGETAAQREENEQRKRRRRRRRGGRRDAQGNEIATPPGESEGDEEPGSEDQAAPVGEADTSPDAAPAPHEASVDPVAGEETVAVSTADEIPSDGPETVELDENGQPKARRRGRRGGRRRRRGEPSDEESVTEAVEAELSQPAAAPAPVYVAPVYTPPVYTGPTPADPFGNTYDIFDMLEQAQQAALSAQQAPARPAPVVEAAPVVETPAPVVIAPEPVAPPTAPEPAPAPAPAEPPAPEAPAPEAIETPVAEPTPPPAPVEPEPVVKPILIGAEDTPVAAPKRGWWRR
jgi:ribonuclease E